MVNNLEPNILHEAIFMEALKGHVKFLKTVCVSPN